MENQFEKIIILENEIESLRLSSELSARSIPFALRSYHDTAYDGLFQFSSGWGHVEAPVSHREEILSILEVIRREPASEIVDPCGEGSGDGHL